MNDAASSPARASAYSYYVVVLLMLAYMLSLMDRVMLGFLIEPVRHELGLSDTQIGLLLGFGFVLFYSILGVPLGAMADRGNRRNLMVGGILVWSLATAGTAFAAGFAGLLLARTLVGAGEATLSPGAVSTIGDRFPRERVGFALSLYSLGGAFGIGVAMAVGGYLVEWTSALSWAVPALGIELSGWRLVFLIVGLAGVPFAVLMLATMREAPRRGERKEHPPLSAVIDHMARHKLAFAGLLLGFGMQVLSTYVPMLWAAAHFQRAFAMSPLQLGLAFTLIFGVATGVGVLIGGAINDMAMRRGISDAPARLVFWGIPLQLPFVWLAFVSGEPSFALWMLGFQILFASLYGGLQGAMVQVLTPSTMHGRMMGIYLFSVTVVGMGVGPLVTGALSQHGFSGNGALGLAMAATMTLALVLAALMLTVARRAMRECADEVARSA
ncbi:putative MFS family arabinose efflux permease [Hephaestia caeni]|uniref:Putative MFS family arabinose efflux permease n=1 Tax=Hephaestia caeni TaxID=645617 RepID=A0A397NW64_9SPHN|nr:MFS transporter [Hephaestia caeni]RIA37984.1 putative MFS family arabinose efflux permease [Hephaestia caeni]